MNYGVILASGKGTRIKDNIDLPKQFRLINDKPVIIYTILNFLKTKRFDIIYIAVSKEYLDYTNKLILEYFGEIPNIKVICGGKERIDSITNCINSIIKDNGCREEDVIVIHDAVRPFVTEKILNDSIDSAREHNAVVCAMPVADTLLCSTNGEQVESIPNRSFYYKGQAPDSFKLKVFLDLLNTLTEDQKNKLTGTSQVCTMNNYPIYMIEGDEINFKITTKSDFALAEAVVKGINEDEVIKNNTR